MATSSSRRSGTRTRRAGVHLTVEGIIAASLRLAARGCDDAFTVRRLGRELGADPTAVYRHFRDMDELMRAVADRVIGEALDGVPAGLGWADRLRALTLQSLAMADKYPVVVVRMASRTLRLANEIRAVEFILGAVLDAGLRGEQAAVFCRLVGNLLNSLNGARAGYLLLPPQVRDADDLSWSREYRAVDPANFPNIAHAGADLASVEDHTVHLAAIDAIILAIRSAAANQ